VTQKRKNKNGKIKKENRRKRIGFDARFVVFKIF